MRKKIVAGNWKMFLNCPETQTLVTELLSLYRQEVKSDVQVILSPAFIHLQAVKSRIENQANFSLAAQNLHEADQGAFTGEVSGPMLVSAGVEYVLIGHSERRSIFQESDARLAAKTDAALKHGLIPIFCIGETLEERENEKTFDVIRHQLEAGIFHLSAEPFKNIIIAYEPVWAIGTGKTASPEQAQEVHAFIRKTLFEKYGNLADQISILYGGSVNPGNAQQLFSCPDIDGGLVGGASLKAKDFIEIIKAR